VQKEDKKDFLEIMVASNTVSQFFDNMIYLETLSAKNREALLNLQDLEDSLKSKKVSLEEETDELKNLIIIQGIKKKKIAKTKQEREYYLGLTEKNIRLSFRKNKKLINKQLKLANVFLNWLIW